MFYNTRLWIEFGAVYVGLFVCLSWICKILRSKLVKYGILSTNNYLKYAPYPLKSLNSPKLPKNNIYAKYHTMGTKFYKICIPMQQCWRELQKKYFLTFSKLWKNLHFHPIPTSTSIPSFILFDLHNLGEVKNDKKGILKNSSALLYRKNECIMHDRGGGRCVARNDKTLFEDSNLENSKKIENLKSLSTKPLKFHQPWQFTPKKTWKCSWIVHICLHLYVSIFI